MGIAFAFFVCMIRYSILMEILLFIGLNEYSISVSLPFYA